MKIKGTATGGDYWQPFGESSPAKVLLPGYPWRASSPGDPLDFGQPFVWTVDGLLDVAEQRSLIDRSQALGFAPAPITTARGFEMRRDIRNNTRVIFDDDTLARDLFERVRACIPKTIFGRTMCGANERFRIYRYDAGECFRPHFDGAFVRNDEEQSYLTLMVYLNDGFGGGETKFLDFDLNVIPRAGTALFFQHQLLHEGAPVLSGVKYVLRTDVMYRTPEGTRKEQEHG